MSGCPGDGSGGTTLNWVWSTWPDDQTALLARQWDEAIPLWVSMAAHARDHGVERIAFELHPLQLVYNVPTLQRMRDAVGPVIGANLDPSHLFWQQMDPLAVIRVLRDAVFHVHLKDTKPEPERLAIAGVLDQKLSASYPDRAWNFRTLGVGHDRAFWEAFVQSLAGGRLRRCAEHRERRPVHGRGRGRPRRRPHSCEPLLAAASVA